MARMHSRKKGKAGSRKPADKKVPKWVEYKKPEVEKIILKLRKEGNSAASIGLILRDRYGIPSVKAVTGRKVVAILRDAEEYPEMPEDMLNLMRKAVQIMAHLEKNRQDKYSKRGLQITESKIRRLGKYYVRKGVLAPDWKYKPEQAKLLVQ